MKKKRYYTDFLFSTSDFWIGAGTVMNLAGNYYSFNSSNSGEEADFKAISNDFNMVGQDIQDTIDKLTSNKERLLVKK